VFELLVKFELLAGGGPDVVDRELWWLALDPSVVPLPVVVEGRNVDVETFEIVVASVEVGRLDDEDELVDITSAMEVEIVGISHKYDPLF